MAYEKHLFFLKKNVSKNRHYMRFKNCLINEDVTPGNVGYNFISHRQTWLYNDIIIIIDNVKEMIITKYQWRSSGPADPSNLNMPQHTLTINQAKNTEEKDVTESKYW